MNKKVVHISVGATSISVCHYNMSYYVTYLFYTSFLTATSCICLKDNLITYTLVPTFLLLLKYMLHILEYKRSKLDKSAKQKLNVGHITVWRIPSMHIILHMLQCCNLYDSKCN